MRIAWLLLVVAACGDSHSISTDASPVDAGPMADAPPFVGTWDKTLPELSGFTRGFTPVRGIVHLHSVYSHDACDNMPRDPSTGVVNEPCLQDLRDGLCADRIDFAALTDHDASMADEDFPTLFSMRDDDEAILGDDGSQIGSKIHCANGHTVMVSVGGENDVMPVMLDRHPDAATIQARHDIYNGYDAATMDELRAAGALAWIAHTEQHPIEDLRALLPDGLEVYNLHANLDPTIRETYLGLDPAGAVQAVANFVDTQPGHPEPDLALLSFLTPSGPAIDRWNQVLADGRHVPATAGSDAHENAFPFILADGERGDSYRRVLRWFSNWVLVADRTDPAQIKAALAGGRMFAVFEIMGTPFDFDVSAADDANHTYELGDTAPVGSTITVHVPDATKFVDVLDGQPMPEVTGHIIYIGPQGAQEVATGPGPFLTAPMSAAGAYRVEVTMIPHHLKPFLGDLVTTIDTTEFPWIYASPIYATAP
ncbi:MAG TPA: hypothetical protein VGM88_31065 [Kofleriaceae bacterium]|jgi:hypothetical protein